MNSETPPSTMLEEELTPTNYEAEESVLGAILMNPQALYDVLPILQKTQFASLRSRWVWDAIIAIHNRHEAIDAITVANELENQGNLANVGGSRYLNDLLDAVPSAINAVSYARIVEQAAIRRRLLDAATSIANLARSQNETIETVLNRSEAAVFAVSEHRITREIQPASDVARVYYDQVQRLSQLKDEYLGIPTGFSLIDRYLNGLQKQDLVIVAGRPGMGKTGLLLNIALNAARFRNQVVGVFSLEMSSEQLVGRLLACETGIDSQTLRRGKLNSDEWGRFTESVGRLSEYRLFIDDTPSITPMQLRTKCRRLYSEFNLDLIVLDYLQLMQGDTRTDNRVQEISQISRQLKGLARELNVPVLAAAQLSRAVEQRQVKKPMLSDLRESGSIEQDADVVMFIYRDEYYNQETTDKPHIAEINIAKHRNGPTGSVDLYFQKELAQFHSLQRQSIKQ
ncbi:MAG: replicative DNA helicase [Chloroflexota bacterium]